MNDISEVRNELECPICMEFMVTEIFICINGHSICKSCVDRVQPNCPICRGLISDRRNYTLEKIAAVLTYPCKSCNKELKAEEVVMHDLHCDSGLFVCNLIFNRCDWKGSYINAKEHIEKNHRETINDWKPIGNYQLYTLFFEDHAFLVFFKILNNLAFYSSIFIGPKKDAEKYVLHVGFQDQIGVGYQLTGASPCISYCKLGQVFDRFKISFSYEMMPNFLDHGRNRFASTITINKKQ